MLDARFKYFIQNYLNLGCALFLVFSFSGYVRGSILDNVQNTPIVNSASGGQTGSNPTNDNPAGGNASVNIGTQVSPATIVSPQKLVKVVSVYNLRAKNGTAAESNKAGIEDIIVV